MLKFLAFLLLHALKLIKPTAYIFGQSLKLLVYYECKKLVLFKSIKSAVIVTHNLKQTAIFEIFRFFFVDFGGYFGHRSGVWNGNFFSE